MAKGESSGVNAAFRSLMGAQAEAQALAGLLEGCSARDGVCWDIILGGALERLSLAVEAYEDAIRAAGIEPDTALPRTVLSGPVLGGRSVAEGGGEAPLQSGARID